MSERKPSLNEIQDHPDNESNPEEDQKKLKYPRSVFFIISNEFCERFCFYGLRTVLTLYLRNQLKFGDETSIIIYHIFTMLMYFFPLFGAIIADSLLGKFRTILYLSIVYAFGEILLSVTAISSLGIPAREISLVALLLVALGTGGIKPCVAAFGGDQFILPQQERYLSTFFSFFYFSINSGSVISSFLTPILRSNVSCFGETTCYSLAFIVPGILMCTSIVIFVVGIPLYKITKPAGNVVLNVCKCASHAIYRKCTIKGEKKQHWLDYADDQYDRSLINDVKATAQVLILFIPLPFFWALYDQQASRWTIQATRMNGELGNFIIQPDQIQALNPLLVLAFIPLFEAFIYPAIAKIGISTPLRKLTAGGLLAALSFVASALVELQLETTYPVLPSEGVAQLRIFNTQNCPVHLTIDKKYDFELQALDMWVEKNITAKNDVNLPYTADFSRCDTINTASKIVEGTIQVQEANATSWVITPNGLSHSYIDSLEKSTSGDSLVRGLIFVNSSEETVPLEFLRGDTVALKIDIPREPFRETKKLYEVKPGDYDVRLNGHVVLTDVKMKLGGVYTLLGSVMNNKEVANVTTVTEPNSMHILWLIPQTVIITCGEIMFSVTGLEFAFTQAPVSMKSLLQAAWLLTVALGNLIVVIVANVSIFKRQMYEYFLFAGLMLADMIIFAVMAKFYKYVEIPESDSTTEEIGMEMKSGIVNESYKSDEK